MWSKWFGSTSRRREDGEMRAFIDDVCRVAVGPIGPADYSPLPLYIMSVLSGYTEQQAVLAERQIKGLSNHPPEVAAVEVADGRTYIFGDAIASALIGSRGRPGIVPRLVEAGKLTPDDDNFATWFGRSASMVGSTTYGRPRHALDDLRLPDIDTAAARANDVWQFLRSGGLSHAQFAGAIGNVCLVALLRTIDTGLFGTARNLTQMAIEAVIAGSHMPTAPTTPPAASRT